MMNMLSGHTLAHLKAGMLALKRRTAIAITGEYNPYPPPPANSLLSPSLQHLYDYEEVPLQLSWIRCQDEDIKSWQSRARTKLAELVGLVDREPPSILSDEGVSNLKVDLVKRTMYLKVNNNSHVPVTFVWKKEYSCSRPVMLCLHGHNSGAHLSWGEVRMPVDPIKIYQGADYAYQASIRGYMAICIEQSCFGMRREQNLSNRSQHPCTDAAHHALLLGRTILGERIADVLSVIDWVASRPENIPHVDGRFYTIGNSAGGDVALYTAALDSRITGVIASGCAGPFRETIGRRRGCPDAVIPGILNWMEYEDILALCAPRPLLIVSGINDHIYPFSLAKKVTERAKIVYDRLNALDKIRAVAGPEGHRFYPEIAWPIFLEMTSV